MDCSVVLDGRERNADAVGLAIAEAHTAEASSGWDRTRASEGDLGDPSLARVVIAEDTGDDCSGNCRNAGCVGWPS
jgi:hypothetical protein